MNGCFYLFSNFFLLISVVCECGILFNVFNIHYLWYVVGLLHSFLFLQYLLIFICLYTVNSISVCMSLLGIRSFSTV